MRPVGETKTALDIFVSIMLDDVTFLDERSRGRLIDIDDGSCIDDGSTTTKGDRLLLSMNRIPKSGKYEEWESELHDDLLDFVGVLVSCR